MRQERHEWSDSQLILISEVCVILYNILVKMASTGELSDDVDDNGVRQSEIELLQEFFLVESSQSGDTVNTNDSNMTGGSDASGGGISHLLERDRMVCSRERHIQLRTELSEHL